MENDLFGMDYASTEFYNPEGPMFINNDGYLVLPLKYMNGKESNRKEMKVIGFGIPTGRKQAIKNIMPITEVIWKKS